jgi:hypothetical protein
MFEPQVWHTHSLSTWVKPTHFYASATVTNKATAAVYTEAVQAVTEGQLETAMDKVETMSDQHRAVMEEHPQKIQYPVAAVNAGLLTYGRSTSQFIESLNNNIVIARNIVPLSALIWLLLKEEERFFENQTLSRETPLDGLIGYVKKKLDKLADKQVGLHAKELATGRYRVYSEGISYVVELPRLIGDDDDEAFGSCTRVDCLYSKIPMQAYVHGYCR